MAEALPARRPHRVGDLTLCCHAHDRHSSPSTSPTGKKPQRTEEGTVTHVADGDTVTIITPNQTKLRVRMFGIDAPETPKGTKFPGSPIAQRPRSTSSNWSRANA